MKKSSSPTLLISVAAAVALWAIATWFESDSRWLPDGSPEPFDTRMPMPQRDTPLRVNTDRLSCQQVEVELTEKVDRSRNCTTDFDCTLFDYGYPIQCLTSVSKSEITFLRLEYRNYEEHCAYRVYYDCPSGESERRAICQNNRCEVSLLTDDPLKDQTLRHLGIKDQ